MVDHGWWLTLGTCGPSATRGGSRWQPRHQLLSGSLSRFAQFIAAVYSWPDTQPGERMPGHSTKTVVEYWEKLGNKLENISTFWKIVPKTVVESGKFWYELWHFSAIRKSRGYQWPVHPMLLRCWRVVFPKWLPFSSKTNYDGQQDLTAPWCSMRFLAKPVVNLTINPPSIQMYAGYLNAIELCILYTLVYICMHGYRIHVYNLRPWIMCQHGYGSMLYQPTNGYVNIPAAS